VDQDVAKGDGLPQIGHFLRRRGIAVIGKAQTLIGVG
jgi:hypothetical protein